MPFLDALRLQFKLLPEACAATAYLMHKEQPERHKIELATNVAPAAMWEMHKGRMRGITLPFRQRGNSLQMLKTFFTAFATSFLSRPRIR